MQVSRRFLTHNGHRLSYQIAGDGAPLVLIPGIMQSANRWREAGYLDALGGEHRLLVLDPLGHGASEKPHDASAYAMSESVAEVVAALDAQQIEQAVLWGYSRGGIVASHVAAAHPDRVSALVLGGSAAVIGIDPAATPPVDAMADALATGDWEQVFAVLRIEDEETRANLRDGNDPIALALAARGTKSAPAPDLSHLVGRIFAYAGTEEPHFAAACESAVRLGIELAELNGLGNAGTFQALDTVLPLVRAFLAPVE